MKQAKHLSGSTKAFYQASGRKSRHMLPTLYLHMSHLLVTPCGQYTQYQYNMYARELWRLLWRGNCDVARSVVSSAVESCPKCMLQPGLLRPVRMYLPLHFIRRASTRGSCAVHPRVRFVDPRARSSQDSGVIDASPIFQPALR